MVIATTADESKDEDIPWSMNRWWWVFGGVVAAASSSL